MLFRFLFLLVIGSLVNGQDYLTLTLGIYSGRPNPYCQIQHNDPKFQEILKILPPPPGTHLKSILGYQGFIVDHVTTDKHTTVSIRAGSDTNLETVLFESCNYGFRPEQKNTLLGWIQSSADV